MNLFLVATSFLLLWTTVGGTVTIASTGKQYPSRPASFGLRLEYGLQYVALLQYVESDLHLCAGIREIGGDDERNDYSEGMLDEDYVVKYSWRQWMQAKWNAAMRKRNNHGIKNMVQPNANEDHGEEDSEYEFRRVSKSPPSPRPEGHDSGHVAYASVQNNRRRQQQHQQR